MGTEIIVALIAAVASLLTTVLGLYTRVRTEKRERYYRQAQEKAQLSVRQGQRATLLSMELLFATCSLSQSTAMALRDGHSNGHLQSALDKADRAKERYVQFMKEFTVESLGGSAP